MKRVSIIVFAVISVFASASVFAHCTSTSIGSVCCERSADGYDCKLV